MRAKQRASKEKYTLRLISGTVRERTSFVPIPGVPVTNGEQIVLTDKDGRYELTCGPAHSFVPLCLPDGYRPGDGWLRRLAQIRPGREADFYLEPAPQSSTCTFAHITDTHLNAWVKGEHICRGQLARDLQEVVQMGGPEFVLATGDPTEAGTPLQLRQLAMALRSTGVPVFAGWGGHDGNSERYAEGAKPFVRNWERVIGPVYFSWNWGGKHFISYAMEDFFFDEDSLKAKEAWLAADLELHRDEEIIFTAHYPPTDELMERLAPYNVVLYLFGHWHSSKVYRWGKTLVCGTPPLVYGGDERTPRSFRWVHLSATGGIDTDLVPLLSRPATLDRPPALRREGRELLRLVWERDLEGDLHAPAPVLDGERLYVNVVDHSGRGRQGVAAFDAGTGAQIWRTGTETSVRSAITLSGDLLLAQEVAGRLVALRAADGALVWERKLRNYPHRFLFTSPAVADGVVYAGGKGGLGAFRLEGGEDLWYVQPDPTDSWACYAGPLVVDRWVLLILYGYGLYAFDRASGEVGWTRPEVNRFELPRPVVTGDAIVAGTGDGELLLIEAESGEILCRCQGGGRFATGLVVRGDTLCAAFANGTVGQWSLPGLERLWSKKLPPAIGGILPYIRDGRQALVAPLPMGRRSLLFAWDGSVHLVNTGGRRLAAMQLDTPVVAVPALQGDRLWVATMSGRVCCFALEGT